MGFFIKITGKQVWRVLDGTWETPGSEIVQEAAGTKSSMIYIGRLRATVAQ